MEDIFNTLCTGIKFNRKQNQIKRNTPSLLKLFHSSGDLNRGDVNSENRSVDEQVTNFESDESINAFRNKLQIKVHGNEICDPSPTFLNMNIHEEIKQVVLKNIELSDWKEPTPIQMQGIPALISGRDVLAAAPTGSGKTAAFVIPALSKVTSSNKHGTIKGQPRKGIAVLLLAPTNELANQIQREAIRLCKGKHLRISTLKRNVVNNAISRQDKNLLGNIDILVSTPMRLIALVRNSLIDLSGVQMLIMDEADKLFERNLHQHHNHSNTNHTAAGEEGGDDEDEEDKVYTTASFLHQMDEILAACPHEGVQKGLFSATLGPFVQEIASGFLNNPVSITVGVTNAAASTIKQKLVFVGREDGKLIAIRQLVQEGIKPPVLLFLQSIDRAKELFKELVFDGINVDVIHADRTQQQRDEVIERFRRGEIWVLICTDLMARGVDFRGVRMVINYDLPQTPVAYIHRIGRTGRAGREGEAITFFTEADIPHLRSIANVMRLSGCEVPDWMLSIKQLTTKQKRNLRSSAVKRRPITTESGFDRKSIARKREIIEQSKRKKLRLG